ncbi:hypothetical protein OHR68_43230 [Spirillospora sp. NBC_00431]
MKRVYLRGYALRADDGNDGDGPIPFVLATQGRKADGLDLQMSSLDLERYRANPVLGYGHAYWGRDGLPIGRVEDPRVDDGRLLGGLVFDRDDDFAATVERKIRNRFINAVSVGFDAHDIDDGGVPARWELFETSVVPLPLDPDAVSDDGRGDELALARALAGVRAGAVLSKANKRLVTNAVRALNELLDAAGGEGEEDDEGRAGTGLSDAERAELERLRSNEAAMRRLARIATP